MSKFIFRPERSRVNPGNKMPFMEFPSGRVYFHLAEGIFCKKIANSHSVDTHGNDVIHALGDIVQAMPDSYRIGDGGRKSMPENYKICPSQGKAIVGGGK